MPSEHPELNSKPESKEVKIPKLHFDFFFGAHVTLKDTEGLEKRFQEADIYVPELSGWTERAKQTFNDVSYGRITPKEAILEYHVDESEEGLEFFNALLNMIYKSYKPIILIDKKYVNQNHDEEKELLDDIV